MRTRQQMWMQGAPTLRQGTARDDPPASPPHGKAPTRTILFATIFAIVLASLAGTTVYLWQREQIRDREAALTLAIEQRDESRRAVEALGADARSDRTRIRALQAQVTGLQTRLERLRNSYAASSSFVYRASDILAAVRAQVPIADPMNWESVSIQVSGQGYAFVLAHPGNIPSGSNVEDSEQVFLKVEGGEWTVIASGTGISPSEVLPPGLQDAFAA